MRSFRYEIGWQATGTRPGHHRSRGRGGGFEFRQLAALASDPDPRRLDLHASLLDPLGELKVRTYRERRAITVWVLADVSASLRTGGRLAKMAVLADFAEAAAYSAYRTGDAFGFVAADGVVREGLTIPAGRGPGLSALVREKCVGYVGRGASATGLVDAARHVGRRRALVFVVSDFHFALALLDAVLGSLEGHDVVPVVLSDPDEGRVADGWGWVSLRDSESGARRRLFARPSLAARLRSALRERQRLLDAMFDRHAVRPLVLAQGFDADRVTDYFAGSHDSPVLAL